MLGWKSPAAYALGIERAGAIEWRMTNYPNSHQLPAVVLGKVLGYRSGSASFLLDLQSLDEAIATLEPAGACPAFEHPNLWAWQQLRTEITGGQLPEDIEIVVVFIGAAFEPTHDKRVRALLGEVGVG